MNCEIYKDLVAAHVDGVLSPDERQDVEEHLGSCQECQLLFSQQQEFQNAFQAKALEKSFIVPVPAAVEQRLQAALAEEMSAADQGSPSLWQHIKDWFQTTSFFPRFAFGLAAAGLFLALLLPRWLQVFSPDSGEPTPHVLTQAVQSYQELAEERPALAYAIQEPAALETAFNGSGELDFVTHVLDLRQAGLQLRGGTIRQVANRPTAIGIYDGDREHIVCIRQQGQMPSHLAGAEGIRGGYLYTYTGHTVFISQRPDHFCTLVSRLSRQDFLRRIALLSK